MITAHLNYLVINHSELIKQHNLHIPQLPTFTFRCDHPAQELYLPLKALHRVPILWHFL